MNKKEFEEEYKDLLIKALAFGKRKKNRTNVDTFSLFDKKITFDASTGLVPIITGKKVFFDKAYHEFYWIFLGNDNIKYLNEHDIYWWDEYADETGYLGKTYGYQLRNYNGNFDQIKYVINEINNNSRRAHITFWNPSELEETSLPCCYTGITFNRVNNKLNMSMQFRSSDLFLGLPYDFIVGWLFLINICEACGLKPGLISYNLTDAHIYENHIGLAFDYINNKHYDLPIYKGNLNLDYTSGPYMKAKLNN